jgi:hypothetical protein
MFKTNPSLSIIIKQSGVQIPTTTIEIDVYMLTTSKILEGILTSINMLQRAAHIGKQLKISNPLNKQDVKI